MTTFESLVVGCFDAFDRVVAERLPVRDPQHWTTPDMVTKLVVGFEQGYFFRWACGEPTVGAPQTNEFLLHQSQSVYGIRVPLLLSWPEVSNAWLEAHEEEDDAIDSWADAWRPVLRGLQLTAAGLVLHRLMERTDLGISPNCSFVISRDDEGDLQASCDQLFVPEDEDVADDPLRPFCAKPETRAWLSRLEKQPGALTVHAIGATKPDLAVMLDGVKAPPEPPENPLKAILATRR